MSGSEEGRSDYDARDALQLGLRVQELEEGIEWILRECGSLATKRNKHIHSLLSRAAAAEEERDALLSHYAQCQCVEVFHAPPRVSSVPSWSEEFEANARRTWEELVATRLELGNLRASYEVSLTENEDLRKASMRATSGNNSSAEVDTLRAERSQLLSERMRVEAELASSRREVSTLRATVEEHANAAEDETAADVMMGARCKALEHKNEVLARSRDECLAQLQELQAKEDRSSVEDKPALPSDGVGSESFSDDEVFVDAEEKLTSYRSLARLRDQNSELRERLQKLQSDNATDEAGDQHGEELALLRAERAQLEDDVAAQAARVATLEGEKQEALAAAEELKAMIEELEEAQKTLGLPGVEEEELRDELQAISDELDRTRGQLERKDAELLEACAVAERDRALMAHVREEHQDELEEVRTQLLASRAEVERLQAEAKQTKTAEEEDEEDELEEVRTQLLASRAEVERLQAEAKQTKTAEEEDELEEVRTQLLASRAEVERLQAEVAGAHTAEVEGERDVLREQVDQLSAKLTKTKEKCAVLKRELARLQQENSELSSKTSGGGRDGTATVGSDSAVRDKNRALKAAYKELSSKSAANEEALRTKVVSLKEKNATLKAEYADLKNKQTAMALLSQGPERLHESHPSHAQETEVASPASAPAKETEAAAPENAPVVPGAAEPVATGPSEAEERAKEEAAERVHAAEERARDAEERVKQAEDRVVQLQAELAAAAEGKNKMEEMKAELAAAKEEHESVHAAAQNELAALRKELEGPTKEVLVQENDALRSKMAMIASASEQKDSEIDEQRATTDSLKAELSGARTELVSMGALRAQLQQLKQELASSDEKNERLLIQKEQLDHQLALMKDDLDPYLELKEKHDVLLAEHGELRTAHEETVALHKAAQRNVTTLEERVAELEDDIDTLEWSKVEHKKQMSGLQREYNVLEQEKDEAERVLTKEVAKAGEMQEALRALEGKHRMLLDQYEEIQQTMVTKTGDIAELKRMYEAAQQDKMEEVVRGEDLRSELAAATKAHNKTVLTLEEAEDTIARLQSELEQAKPKCGSVTNVGDVGSGDDEASDDQVEALEWEIKKMRAELDRTVRQLQDAQSIMEGEREERKQLFEEHELLKRRHAAALAAPSGTESPRGPHSTLWREDAASVSSEKSDKKRVSFFDDDDEPEAAALQRSFEALRADYRVLVVQHDSLAQEKKTREEGDALAAEYESAGRRVLRAKSPTPEPERSPYTHATRQLPKGSMAGKYQILKEANETLEADNKKLKKEMHQQQKEHNELAEKFVLLESQSKTLAIEHRNLTKESALVADRMKELELILDRERHSRLTRRGSSASEISAQRDMDHLQMENRRLEAANKELNAEIYELEKRYSESQDALQAVMTAAQEAETARETARAAPKKVTPW